MMSHDRYLDPKPYFVVDESKAEIRAELVQINEQLSGDVSSVPWVERTRLEQRAKSLERQLRDLEFAERHELARGRQTDQRRGRNGQIAVQRPNRAEIPSDKPGHRLFIEYHPVANTAERTLATQINVGGFVPTRPPSGPREGA